ncbi:hypothetical protein AB7C87_13590 [Natrarchaeobius sp. A-rgal3]|uniref:hypothetical protein n=1 Tax=Natrarchaeobius versutus TaxID=1679078 RepID=UPI00350F465C
MATKLTIHCDCGTDVRTETTDGTIACPDCKSVFETTIIELTTDHNASHTRYGTRSCRGP